MSQFLKMVSSDNFINTSNIDKSPSNTSIQNQQINSSISFKHIGIKEVEQVSAHKPVVIANTLFA